MKRLAFFSCIAWNTTSAEANSIKCAYEAHRINHFHPFWAEVYDPSLDKWEALVELEPPTIIVRVALLWAEEDYCCF